MTKPDPEIEAMSKVATALDSLDETVRQRVLGWATERFGATRPDKRKVKDPSGEREADDPPETIEEFAHFGDVAEAIGAKTEADYVLAAAFWLQKEGQPTFQSAPLNKVLKDAGRNVSNVSRSLTEMTEGKVAFVRQLAKSGKAKQARKTFKLTDAGAAEVHKRMSEAPAEGS